jgi:hypothetical protein
LSWSSTQIVVWERAVIKRRDEDVERQRAGHREMCPEMSRIAASATSIFALSPAVWHGDEMRWRIVLAIAVLAGVAGAFVWYVIASVFDPPGFVNLSSSRS